MQTYSDTWMFVNPLEVLSLYKYDLQLDLKSEKYINLINDTKQGKTGQKHVKLNAWVSSWEQLPFKPLRYLLLTASNPPVFPFSVFFNTSRQSYFGFAVV